MGICEMISSIEGKYNNFISVDCTTITITAICMVAYECVVSSEGKYTVFTDAEIAPPHPSAELLMKFLVPLKLSTAFFVIYIAPPMTPSVLPHYV